MRPTSFVLLVLWLAISFSMTALGGHEEEWIDTIPAERLKRLLDSGVKIFLVDLRPAKEFQQNRLSGARSIPSIELASRLNEISKTGRVVLYCACQKSELADKGAIFEISRLSKYLRHAGRVSGVGETRLPG
jgi:hypothetical protein